MSSKRMHSRIWIQDNVFHKQYPGISHKQWNRLHNVATLLSQAQLSPRLLSSDIHRKQLSWEVVTPLTRFSPEEDPPEHFLKMGITGIKQQIREKIHMLHDLGYGHGDLHIGNLGMNAEGNIVLLDIDTVFLIHGKKTKWLRDFIRHGYDSDLSLEELAEMDWENWQTDWLES